MTPLKAGAIALTLIIAMPIILGYGMASEDVEKTVETTENGGNLSSIILNSTTPYYIPYNGANNNGYLYISSDDITGLTNPDYVSTSSTTRTFTPIFWTENESYPLASAETVTYTGSTTNDDFPSFLTAKLTFNVDTELGVHIEDFGVGTIVSLDAGDSIYLTQFEYGSLTCYRVSGFEVEGVSISEYIVDGLYFSDATLEYVDTYTDFNVDVDSWAISVNGVLALKLTYSDNTTYETCTVLAEGLFYTGTTLITTIDGGNTTYSDVSAVSIAMAPDVAAAHYTTTGGTTIRTYADVSTGWRTLSNSGIYTQSWFNGFENYSIRMMIHIEAGESFVITPDSYNSQLIADSDSNGIVTIYFGSEPKILGKYTDIMLDVGVRDAVSKYATVVASGLAEWPTYGETPETVYNTVTLESTFSFNGPFEQLEIGGSDTVEIRVDSANIVGGYFASTNDYYYYPYSLYPDDKIQSVVIDSIGIYGDNLNLGGVWRDLSDDNTISFTDADTSETVTASVLGLVVKFVENDDGDAWTTYINGHRLSEHASAPFMAFGGEWSLTLHRTVTTTESVTTQEWVPGEFALDENGFVMAMLLVALAAFVGLGMTGGRSGAKVGILALICGGAVMVGLTIL